MNGIVGTAPQSTTYVRALYDYEADDRTSLSFHEGDVIQVITQLESGWWDGVINGVRGWFPSNYCQLITSPDDVPDPISNGHHELLEERAEELDIYEDGYDQDEDSEGEGINGLPMEGTDFGDKSRADFWIPQATPDGRLFYYNMMTGDRSMELPLESPVTTNETGPRDRMNAHIPEKTRPPPEMMARGMTQDEDYDSSTSVSEVEGDAARRERAGKVPRGSVSSVLSPSTSMDSINGIPAGPRTRKGAHSATRPPAQTPNIASATSFISTSYNQPTTTTVPKSFFDDGATPPLTWSVLVTNMKRAIERYREAITNENRAEYVARAEDISDHLRLLLSAGSGTTDNHSGQPSIISTNKALYPHFRDMMSKFSKLVISSHIAAADWPNAESVQKCLQEADGVLLGVFSYVEVAKQQRGEDIPRLFPGFVIGSTAGGSWKNNGLSLQDPITADFFEDEEGATEPSKILDGKLLSQMDEQRRLLAASLRELDKNLVAPEKTISPVRHEMIGNNVCYCGGRVVDVFKPWISMIESIDLSVLGNSFQTPQLAEFSTNKQTLYDNIADLVLGCQAVAGPLADEWAEVRGEALESRMDYVRQCARALETNSTHVGFSLQLLQEQVQINLNQHHIDPRGWDNHTTRNHSLQRVGTMPAERPHHRTESRTADGRPPLLMTQSFSEGEAPPTNFRKGDQSKVKKILGEDPSPQMGLAPTEDTPEYLRLDYEHEVTWESKDGKASVRSGTLMGLVEQLTRHDKLDSNFNNTFLLTYRSFTTAQELFEMLVKRFNTQPPPGLSPSDFEVWRDRKQKLIRFRVVNILKSWFESFWMEEFNDESRQLIRDVSDFAQHTVAATETPGSGPLKMVLEQRLSGKEAGARKMVQTLNQNTPQPIMPRNMRKLKLLDIDTTEFARQLTIIESRLYGKIKASETLAKTWNKDKEAERDIAPNVKTLIMQSNQTTNWIAEMILNQSDARKRVVVIKYFVQVADKCRAMNNYSSLTAIISAFSTAPISRLKRTWELLPARTAATLESLRTTMGNTRNFAEYREQIHAANPPCVPFFGVFLTDLTFIEDGIPSIIKKTNLINFAKRSKTAEVIWDIQQYQNVGYSLQPVPELQDYILSNVHVAGDVHEMYNKSLQIEPREREDEKIVRVLAESGFL